MGYLMPLEKRRRVAARRKERYHSEPGYRLARINDARAQRGLQPIRSLDEMGDPRAGRKGAPRDERGRFA